MTNEPSAYQRIIHAVTVLLAEKDIEKISITDITKKANVSRTTFYNHFDDRDSLIQEIIQKEFEVIRSILSQDMLFKVPVLTEMLEHIKDIGFYMRTWYYHYPPFEKIINDFITDTIKHSEIDHLEEQLEDGYEIPQKYAFNLYVLTIQSIIFKWIEDDFKESSKEIAQTIHAAVQI